MWWQKVSQGYQEPHRPNHSCYKPGTPPDVNPTHMTGPEDCLQREILVLFLESSCFLFCLAFFLCLRNAPVWLNSGAAVWVLAGVASLWLSSLNCSSSARLRQTNSSLTHSSICLFLFLTAFCHTISFFFLIYTQLNIMRNTQSVPFVTYMSCVCVRVCARTCFCVSASLSFSGGLRFLRWRVLSLLTRSASDVAHHMLRCVLCLHSEIGRNI